MCEEQPKSTANNDIESAQFVNLGQLLTCGVTIDHALSLTKWLNYSPQLSKI